MFKQAAYAVAAAAAFAASPASAAITVNYGSGGQTVNLALDTPEEATGSFSFLVTALSEDGPGAFEATYTFLNTFFDPAKATTSVIFGSLSDVDEIAFTSITLDGIAGTFVDGENNGTNADLVVFNDPVELGQRTLKIFGTFNPAGNNSARIAGTLSLTQSAVPEPAAWALFILGFGAIGGTMRRRSSQMRVTKASLKFA